MSKYNELEKALDNAADSIEIAAEVRKDLVVKNLLSSFSKSGITDIDFDSIEEEVKEMAKKVTFKKSEFTLDNLASIESAKNMRLRAKAQRDRMIAISHDLRVAKSMCKKFTSVAYTYAQNLPDIQRLKNAGQRNDMCVVVFREVASLQSDIDIALDLVKDTLGSLKEVTNELDAWFNLHKQYVFLSGNRGPYGE